LTTPNMQISYKYDKFGNILSATDDTYSLSYVYDNNAKVLRSSYDDKDIVYSYDENELFYMGFEDRSFYCSRDKPNNILTIQTNSLDKFEFVYDTQDNIVFLKYPNDFTMTNKYTNLSKLCFSTTPHKELSYIYDNNNQIVSHNDIRYKYDSNQRLIKSNDKSYSYDLSNNLLSYNSIYDTITNQLISNDIYECNYDILGNMTQKHNKQTHITTYYKYDDLSRLIEYKQIDNTSNDTIKELRLSYNPLSQRASKYYKDKDESYYHKYIYDKHNIIGIYDARSDELLASFIHILDNIDRPLSITTNKGIYYYHLDTNNSVIAISNKLGEIVQSFTYDDFGYIIDKYTHLEYKEIEVLNPYAYTSREYDSEELYYYRARYYDPTIQRFITPDPISYLSKDINFYAYVSNNPINLTDPSGLSPQVDIPNLDILSNIYGKNIAKDLPKNSFIDILTPPTSPTNAEPMGKDGFKVKGVKPKLDIGNTLYFVFYTKGGTKNDSIFQDTAKARVKYIKEDTLYCKDTDIVYLLEANKTSQILSLVKEKVAKHGGEEKTIIRSIEVFADSLEKQTNNVFNTIDEKIEQMKSNAENEWEKAINGFHSANEQMVRLFNGAQKIYYGLTNSLNTLEHNKDTIKNNISDAYNKAHPAAQMSLNTSLTLVEFGATIWLPIVIQIPYDFYSGANFNTIPTSPSGFIGNQLNTPLN
ncbi:MAG: RHS repeat-associated core domain-containing protein, partial [Arcobacteraceae bacterium]|nr:RHS repeat-associated core domain-containing protein [Arcobacteraceae bacterium]